MRRYRYSNGSSKRRVWEGAHNFAKGHRSTQLPVKLRSHPIGISAELTLEHRTLRCEGFADTTFTGVGVEKGGATWWRQNLLAMKEAWKAEHPEEYRKTKRARPRGTHRNSDHVQAVAR